MRIKSLSYSLFILSFALFISDSASASSPKREFRATWFTTHYAIDWPKTQSKGTTSTIAAQQQEMINIINQLHDGHLNAFCLQVRPMSDAYYNSPYEPWGKNLTGQRGKDPGYDPLEFAVEQGHRRGMEVHAWVNPFRYEVNDGEFPNAIASGNATADSDPIRSSHPDWLIHYSNGTFNGTILNPGIPEAREYVVKVLMDIVTRYDIDGILMDDYFYAYGGTTVEDSTAVRLYKPDNISVADWRRENVNKVIHALYDSIQTVKPWVKFGMGPGGIYSMDESAAAKYGLTLAYGIVGGDPYTSLYCDPLAWIQGGYIDYLAPQIYWATTTTKTDYDVLCEWWGDAIRHLCDDREDGKHVHLYISQACYRFGVDELTLEINDNREFAPYNAPGSVFYNTNTYLDLNGAPTCEELSKTVFHSRALPPVVDWKPATALSAVENLRIENDVLLWSHNDSPRFSVYAFPKGLKHDKALSVGDYLLGMTYYPYFNLKDVENADNLTFVVCPMDRYGNEYTPAFFQDAPEMPVYLVLVTSGNENVGTVSGGGEFMHGSVITLTATPKYGYEFTGWSDGNTDNPRQLTVNDNISLTAYFSLIEEEPVLQGTLSREMLWWKNVQESGFMQLDNAHRSIAFCDGKLYVSNGKDYQFHILDASTGAFVKTVILPERYHAWHNLRITDDGVMLLGNSQTNSNSIAFFRYDMSSTALTSVVSLDNNSFGRTDYFYPIGEYGESGYLTMLSNVSNKVLVVPFSNGAMEKERVVYHNDLPTGTSAKAVPADANSFFASTASHPATRHSLATGELLESWAGNVKPNSHTQVSGLAYFKLAGHKYLLLPYDNFGAFETFDITYGLPSAERKLAATYPLGETDNKAFTIDFAHSPVVFDDTYSTVVYVLAPNNGIAAYRYVFTPDNTEESLPLNRLDEKTPEKRIIDGILYIILPDGRTYNIFGQLVKTKVYSSL